MLGTAPLTEIFVGNKPLWKPCLWKVEHIRKHTLSIQFIFYKYEASTIEKSTYIMNIMFIWIDIKMSCRTTVKNSADLLQRNPLLKRFLL